jgi:hypothetical protein
MPRCLSAANSERYVVSKSMTTLTLRNNGTLKFPTLQLTNASLVLCHRREKTSTSYAETQQYK